MRDDDAILSLGKREMFAVGSCTQVSRHGRGHIYPMALQRASYAMIYIFVQVEANPIRHEPPLTSLVKAISRLRT